MQDDPNFSKYAENIFYNKNYVLKSFYDDGLIPKDQIYDMKEIMYDGLEKEDISKLREQLKNYKFEVVDLCIFLFYLCL